MCRSQEKCFFYGSEIQILKNSGVWPKILLFLGVWFFRKNRTKIFHTNQHFSQPFMFPWKFSFQFVFVGEVGLHPPPGKDPQPT